MGRRKYRFADRAEAESQFIKAEAERCRVGWLLSAMLNGTNKFVGKTDRYSVGYVCLRHTMIVYAITNKHGDVHRVAGVWNTDGPELQGVINTQFRYEDSYEFAELLEKARRLAYEEASETVYA